MGKEETTMEINLQRCPFCGYSEFIEARQYHSEAYVTGGALLGQELKHTVCRHCGSVVRTYVENPELLLKRKDRRTKE